MMRTAECHRASDRVVRVGELELRLFAQLFDGSDIADEARLPAIHTRQLIAVLACLITEGNNRRS